MDRVDVLVVEASADIGGVWYHNGYPGACCDVESNDYSHSFSPELEQEWRWSERYATQPEILRYINHVADRFDLRRDIQFNTRMTSATYDETSAMWVIATQGGKLVRAKCLMMCVGQLSTTKSPNYPGLSSFKGEVIHSGVWPKREVIYAGKRVAIIGTGSSRVKETLYLSTDSNYNDAEVKGKPRVFMPYSGGVRGYRRILHRCVEEGYSGFAFYKTPAALEVNAEFDKV